MDGRFTKLESKLKVLYRSQIFWLGFLIIFIASWLSITLYLDNRAIHRSAKYTIGVISQVSKDGSVWFVFRTMDYRIIKKNLPAWAVPATLQVSKRDCFLVIYAVERPNACTILFAKPLEKNVAIDSVFRIPIDDSDIVWYKL